MEESYGSYFHPLGSAVHPGEVLCGAGLAQGVARLAWGYVSLGLGSGLPVGSGLGVNIASASCGTAHFVVRFE